ncbi:MAG: hypothetical protein NT133_02030 [Alphaproteobacteria bacterium]|nr:hypothetical protein [Alphaproteobacteria bacterium]
MAEAQWPGPLVEPGAAESLTTRIRCMMSRLDETQAAARRTGTHTGNIAVLDLAANRVRREYTGHLYRDAARSLDRLAIGIDQMRAELGLSIREDCT